jgi:hypothetical protein
MKKDQAIMPEKFEPSSSYDPGKFIDREEEINQVILLLSQEQSRVRALVINGDRGVGKTWLSLHLHRRVFKKDIKGVKSWVFGLWSPGESYRPEESNPQENEHFVRENKSINLDEFLTIIIESLSIELPPNPVQAEKVDLIRRFIQQHADERFDFGFCLRKRLESTRAIGRSFSGQFTDLG